MKKNSITIINQIDLLKRTDLGRLLQTLNYTDTLKLEDAIIAAKEQAKAELKMTIKKLEQNYDAKLAEALAHNQAMLEIWQQKQEVMSHKIDKNISQLTRQISNLLNLDQRNIDLITSQITKALYCQSIYDEKAAIERNLQIKLSFNDYCCLKEQFSKEMHLKQTKYPWLHKFLKISYELNDGTVILEDDFTCATLSYSQIENFISNLLSNIFQEMEP